MTISTKRKRKLGCFITLGIVALLAIGGTVAGVVASKREKPVEVTVEKSSRRTLTSIVSATGKVQPVVEVKISSEVAGEIIDLPIVEGQKVERGQVLVRIKPDTYESAVRQREAGIAASRAQALQVRARLLRAEQDLRRLLDLGEQFVSPSELDAARTEVEVQRALAESSQFEIQQQEMALEQARENLAKTTTVSPIDGTISLLGAELGERVVGTGQFAGTEILRVADLANMEVRIEVNENDVVNVAVGNKAKLTIDAYRGKTFEGVVTRIANSARVAGERTQEQVTTFEVRIRIEAPDVVLRPGMTATADIETNTVEDVVAVPLQAVAIRDREGGIPGARGGEGREGREGEQRPEGQASSGGPGGERRNGGPGGRGRGGDRLQRVVFVKDGDTVAMRVVETGITDPTHIEIKSGLEEGVEIVTGPYSALTRSLKDGAKVVLRKPDARRGGPGGGKPDENGNGNKP